MSKTPACPLCGVPTAHIGGTTEACRVATLERSARLQAERDAAVEKAEVLEAEVAHFTEERDAALARAEAAEGRLAAALELLHQAHGGGRDVAPTRCAHHLCAQSHPTAHEGDESTQPSGQEPIEEGNE